MVFNNKVSRRAVLATSVLIATVVFLASCFKKEKFDTLVFDDTNMGWGLPLIDSELSLGDIINSLDSSKALIKNADESYTFTYSDVLIDAKAERIFTLADKQILSSTAMPATVPAIIPAGTSINEKINGSESLIIAEGSQLKSILFKAGSMTTLFSTGLRHSVTAVLTIPSLKKNGAAYTHTFVTTFANGSNSVVNPDVIDLNGYNLDLTNNNVTTNTINYTIDVTITGSGQPVAANEKFNLTLELKGLKFKNMVGNLTAAMPFDTYDNSTNISIFDNALEGNVFFQRATVTITTANSFGIPIALKIDNMETSTAYSGDNTTVAVTTTNNSANISLDKGAGSGTIKAPTAIGNTETTIMQLNKDNSNVEAMIKPAPNKLRYKVTPQFVGGANQFITDESRLTVTFRVDIPVYGILERYTLGDTLGIDKFPARSSDTYSVDSVRFTFKTTNSLPVDAFTQIYFVDSLNRRIDSLLVNPNEFIKRPIIDSQGKAIQATEQTTIVHMGGRRYDNIMARTKDLYLISKLLTSKDEKGVQQNIQVFSYNKLRIQICALAIGQAKLSKL